jgi:hypothetical protein
MPTATEITERLAVAIAALEQIANAENGSRGAYQKFEQGRQIARRALERLKGAKP